MKTIFCAAILAVLAGQANALSCLFGGGAVAFDQANSQGHQFRAVIGTVLWDLPNDGFPMEYEGQEYDVPARFVGEVMLAGGGRAPIDAPIRVRSSCINGDCGYASTQGAMLTFLHNTRSGTIMNAFPCQSYPLAPNDENVAQVQSCLNGGPCTDKIDH